MMRFDAPQYDVQRPTGQCAVSGRRLEVGEPYVATLVEEGESLRRVDVALDVWEAGRRPDHLFSYWKTVVPEPNRKKKTFVDNDVLMHLLRRLESERQPSRVTFRFVLALVLMRKKLLRYDETRMRTGEEPDGERTSEHWWIMTPKRDLSKGPMGKWDESERIEVLDPRLDEAGIRRASEQLGEILQGDLE